MNKVRRLWKRRRSRTRLAGLSERAQATERRLKARAVLGRKRVRIDDQALADAIEAARAEAEAELMRRAQEISRARSPVKG